MKSIFILCGIIISFFAAHTQPLSPLTQSRQTSSEITSSVIIATDDNTSYISKPTSSSIELNESKRQTDNRLFTSATK